ncbi:MAG: methyltransferase domain-containing protein [Deltaproteobacteria bacterium]|nr:methyltransferase domain-containing protein [Deltaproteobacteria bacterium]
MNEFYSFSDAPVHSVQLIREREDAISYPRGSIRLGFCEGCGFISNTAYDPSVQEYSGNCEETQGFSDTFNAFAKKLAAELIEKYSLRGRHIIEIGCGKGEFLTMLCEMGKNIGTGFDPAYVDGRYTTSADVKFIKDFYSEKYCAARADFIICKMTLEHIGETGSFLKTLRKSLEGRPDTVLFFQVPDVTRVLGELAFWDIYYEHCSYFSPGSIARLFRASGFEVTGIRKDYGGQYIILEARPSGVPSSAIRTKPLPDEDDFETIKGLVEYFAQNISYKLSSWKSRLDEFERKGLKTVIWGSGSKGVSFLTTLAARGQIAKAVDINPYRKGTFMAGTGHEIIAPENLLKLKPDAVIVMNPVYTVEVERELARLGIKAELLTT